MSVSVWKSGLLSRCPACGNAPLFDGLLTIKPKCIACGADFRGQDSGDGPAVFVILVAGALCVPMILVFQLALHPPIWLLSLIALPLTAGVCLALLRPFKAMLYAMQYRHNAGEGVQASPLRDVVSDTTAQQSQTQSEAAPKDG